MFLLVLMRRVVAMLIFVEFFVVSVVVVFYFVAVCMEVFMADIICEMVDCHFDVVVCLPHMEEEI